MAKSIGWSMVPVCAGYPTARVCAAHLHIGGRPVTHGRSLVLCLLAMLAALATALPIPARADNSGKITIRCDKSKTIADALAQQQGGPLTVEVVGTCFEHVTVRRSGVTLVAGAPGAAIQGTDSKVDTLTVIADRFVLDGLSVSGGRNGIVVTGGSQAQLRNCAVRGAGSGIVSGVGILFRQGASGSVDSCNSSGNTADGIFLDGSIVTITNSTIKGNARNGVFVFGGSTGRIGVTNDFAAGPNTISDNGANGIQVTLGSLGIIYGNTVTGNGTNPNSPLGRFGVVVVDSRADLPGGNTITGNFASGIAFSKSTGFIGDPGFGLPTVNVIRGNSTAAPSQGVVLFLGSAVVMRNATVEANNGAGVALTGRSTLSVFSGSVTNNSVNGFQLSQGSAVVFNLALAPIPSPPPLASISGNTGTDLLCVDSESSFSVVGPLPLPGNPTVACSAF